MQTEEANWLGAHFAHIVTRNEYLRERQIQTTMQRQSRIIRDRKAAGIFGQTHATP